MAIITPEFAEQINQIPGEDGFWKSAAEDSYMDAARTLLDKGLNEHEILDILSSLYYGAARCFGD